MSFDCRWCYTGESGPLSYSPEHVTLVAELCKFYVMWYDWQNICLTVCLLDWLTDRLAGRSIDWLSVVHGPWPSNLNERMIRVLDCPDNTRHRTATGPNPGTGCLLPYAISDGLYPYALSGLADWLTNWFIDWVTYLYHYPSTWMSDWLIGNRACILTLNLNDCMIGISCLHHESNWIAWMSD